MSVYDTQEMIDFRILRKAKHAGDLASEALSESGSDIIEQAKAMATAQTIALEVATPSVRVSGGSIHTHGSLSTYNTRATSRELP